MIIIDCKKLASSIIMLVPSFFLNESLDALLSYTILMYADTLQLLQFDWTRPDYLLFRG
jgi:hypothetical protein